jgi:hypothetical protein
VSKPRRRTTRAEWDALMSLLWQLDGGCVAKLRFDAPGPCRGRWGDATTPRDPVAITVEHVQDAAGIGLPRAEDDLDHTVLLCAGHGIQSWELSHKPELRNYIRKRNARYRSRV